MARGLCHRCFGQGSGRFSLGLFVGGICVYMTNGLLMLLALGSVISLIVFTFVDTGLEFDYEETGYYAMESNLTFLQFECEESIVDQLIMQPINTISAGIYFIFGFYCIALSVRDFRIMEMSRKGRARSSQSASRLVENGPNGEDLMPGYTIDPESPALMLKQPLWSLVFGLNFILLGIGGVTYHATQSILGIYLDMIAWWSVFLTFAVFSIARIIYLGLGSNNPDSCCSLQNCLGIVCVVECSPTANRVGNSIFTILCIVAICLGNQSIWENLDIIDESTETQIILISSIVGTFIVSTVLLAVARRNEIKSVWSVFFTGSSLLAIGFLFRFLDTFICTEDSFFQLHAIWHIFSGFGVFILYVFYRGDVRKPIQDFRYNETMSVISGHSSRAIRSVRASQYSSARSPLYSSRSVGSVEGMHYGVNRVANGNSTNSIGGSEARHYSNRSSSSTGSGRSPPLQVATTIGSRSSVGSNGPRLPSSRSSVGSNGPRVPSSRSSVGSRTSSSSRGSNSRSSRSSQGTNNNMQRIRSFETLSTSSGGTHSDSGTSSQRLSGNRVKQGTMPRIPESELEGRTSDGGPPNADVAKRLAELRERQRILRNERSRLAKERNREKSRPAEKNQSDERKVIARWTCSTCGNKDNELQNEQCTSCGHTRPPLNSMIRVPQPV